MNITSNIALYIHPTFWILASFIAWMGSANMLEFGIWVIVVFVSVLAHELGHALMARAFKQRVHIELGPFGGLTVRHGGGSLSKFKEFLVVLMGPLFGFLLAGVALLLLSITPAKMALLYLLNVTVYANVFWSILNLLPVHPLDGGKLMSIGVEALFGPSSVRYSYLASGLFALLLMVAFFSLGSFLGVILFVLFSFESFHAFFQVKPAYSSSEDQLFVKQLQQAQRLWEQNSGNEAIDQLEKIVMGPFTKQQRLIALELAVDYLLLLHENKKAYSLLWQHVAELSGTLINQMQIASYRLGRFDEALEYGKKAFLEEQNITSAILNGYSCIGLKDIEQAIHWLKAVRRIDIESFKKVLDGPEVSSILKDPVVRAQLQA